jgi:hypothetical protein
MLVVVVALLATGGGALKSFADRQAMQGMIADYGKTLATLPQPPGLALQAFVAARAQAEAGNFEAARAKLKEGAAAFAEGSADGGPGPEVPGLGPGGAPSEEMMKQALEEVPAKARPFFEKHPDLLREATMLRMAAASGHGRAAGGKLQKLVDEAVTAAAVNNEQGVREALGKIHQVMGPGRGGPGPGGSPEDELRGGISQARAILGEARKAGADTTRASATVDQAESLLNQGKAEQAAGKLREVFDQLRQMAAAYHGGGPGGPRGPRGGMRRGMRGGPPGAPPGMPPGMPDFMPGMIGALLGEMQWEAPQLKGVLNDLEAAGSMIFEKNRDQVRETLGLATDKVLGIRKSRDELQRRLDQEHQRAMREMQAPGPGGRPPRGRGPQPGPGGPPPGGLPFDPQQAHDLIGRALDDARGMSPDDYAQAREDMVRRVVVGLLSKGKPGPMTPIPGGSAGPVDQGIAPIETPKAEPTELAARGKLEAAIRDRLRFIQEPYAKLCEIGVDMTEVGRLVQEARKAVNDRQLVEAAKSTNHATDLLFQLLDLHRDEMMKAMQEGKGQ